MSRWKLGNPLWGCSLEEIIKLCREGKTAVEIAREQNLSDSWVRHLLRSNGLRAAKSKRGPQPKLTGGQLEKMLSERQGGATSKDLATKYGVDWHVINRYCRSRGVNVHDRLDRAQRTKCLRNEAAIRKNIASGATVELAAEKFGVSVHCMRWFRREKRMTLDQALQRCTICGRVKHWTEFAEKSRRFKNQCRECAQRRREQNNAKVAADSRYKRRHDARWRLNASISTAMRTALNGRKNGRHWETLVGYTLDQLMVHLEHQFQPGMTWENHGKCWPHWNIDHVIPIAAFNYTESTDPGFKACWALSNLQPMWAIENQRKNDRILVNGDMKRVCKFSGGVRKWNCVETI